ncbi:MAG: HAMP domain-containing histidine kinase, partial [Lachnospiraceae bacterium]|nr:HAMP domain-containing histidine kinase [Lachnospiraceae bacterium]
MKKRTSKQVKRKPFLSSGKRMLLAVSQQICGVLALLCAVVVITNCTVYVQTNLSSEEKTVIVFNPFEEKKEVMIQYSGSVAEEGLQNVLEFVAIRTQMEENGLYSASKEISITDYYNRRTVRSEYEFPEAVYRLEDLLRWYQYGGLEYTQNSLYFMEDGSVIADRERKTADSGEETTVVYETEEGALAKQDSDLTEELPRSQDTMTMTMEEREETAPQEESFISGGEEVKPPLSTVEEMEEQKLTAVSSTDRMVYNTFLTVDGKTLEEIAGSADEYWELIRQLESCMEDLSYNYALYLEYQETLGSDSTIQYYVQTNDEEGTCFTNLNFTWQESGLTANSYFQSREAWICYTHSGTRISDMLAEYGIRPSMVVSLLKKYPYAYDVETEVWISFSSDELQEATVAMDDLYDGWNPQKMIALLGACAVLIAYDLLVLIYRLSTTGKKMDESGQVYIECRWGDGLYLELWLICILALTAAIGAGGCKAAEYLITQNISMSELSVWIYCLTATISLFLNVSLTELLCSMARRIRAGMVFRQSFLWHLITWLKTQCRKGIAIVRKETLKRRDSYYAHAGILSRSVGTLLRENLALLAAAGAAATGLLLGRTWLLVGGAVLFFWILILVMGKKYRLTLEKEQIIHDIGLIVDGDPVQINTENLMPENKQLADSVNTIGKGIQQAVEQSVKDERLKAELLTNVSHDIKTPLTSIISYVDLLKREDLGDNETAREYLEILDNKSNKLKQLILDLIEISKINSGSLEYEIAPLKLHELMLQAMGEYEDKLSDHHLKLVYNNRCEEAVIEADARRLWRVVDNLMSNVCKYSLEGTRVYVDVWESEG